LNLVYVTKVSFDIAKNKHSILNKKKFRSLKHENAVLLKVTCFVEVFMYACQERKMPD